MGAFVISIGDTDIGGIQTIVLGIGTRGRRGVNGVADVSVELRIIHAGDRHGLRRGARRRGESQAGRTYRALGGIVAGQGDHDVGGR